MHHRHQTQPTDIGFTMRYVCRVCAPRAPALVAHTDAAHTGGKPFTCRCCGVDFVTLNDLSAHALANHEQHNRGAAALCCCGGCATCCCGRAGARQYTIMAVFLFVLLALAVGQATRPGRGAAPTPSALPAGPALPANVVVAPAQQQQQQQQQQLSPHEYNKSREPARRGQTRHHVGMPNALPGDV